MKYIPVFFLKMWGVQGRCSVVLTSLSPKEEQFPYCITVIYHFIPNLALIRFLWILVLVFGGMGVVEEWYAC